MESTVVSPVWPIRQDHKLSAILTLATTSVILRVVDGLYRQFGRHFREARKEAGLTQEHVAERVGLTRTSVTNIERGRQHISLHQLYLLAAAVGRQPAELLPDHDRGVDELLPQRALKDLQQDAEGLDFATRVLRKSRAQPLRRSAAEQ
jgi:transcriptional regulator with XRE-family HTH domain